MIPTPTRPGLATVAPPVLVCPDLHAWPRRLELLRTRLSAARRRWPQTHLALLGDTLDRGPAGDATQAFVRAELDAGTATLITGNHEAMACVGMAETTMSARGLFDIWRRFGGKAWTEQMGGHAAARAELAYLREQAVLAAEVPTARGAVLLVHGRVPDAAGWALIAALGAVSGDGVARLEDATADDVWVESPGAALLWGNPLGPLGSPASPTHVLAMHGHITGGAVRRVPGATPLVMLDLENRSRLATALITPGGDVEIES